MILLGIIATVLMVYYAGYLFRCEHYFSKLSNKEDLAGFEKSTASFHPEQQLSNLALTDATIKEEFGDRGNPRPGVSIIVPARNEEEHIKACLTDIFAQNYPDGTFEVILVNDHSEDRTREIALEVGVGHPDFRLIDLEKKQGVAYKKAAVARGIDEAHGSIIVVTDADCRMGPGWISGMVAGFKPDVGMVSGPVLLESETVFGDLQALEFMGLIAVGAGSIGAGSPNMCNGANLAYRKEVFEEVGGFSGIDQIASGDDELLMHKIADLTNWRIAFAKRPEAIVRTQAHRTWKAFREQRLRWVSKSTHYQKSSITWTLILSYLAILSLPVLLALSFVAPVLWPFFWINFTLKILAEATILRAAARFFDKLPLMRWLIPEQIVHVLYVLWVGIAGNRKSYTWKGRKVK